MVDYGKATGVFLNKVRNRWNRDKDQPPWKKIVTHAKSAVSYAGASFAGLTLRKDCNEVGAWARIVGGFPRIDNRGFISIGAHSLLSCSYSPVQLSAGPEGRLVISDGAVINFGVILSAKKSVNIGNNVSIGPYCIIADTEFTDPTNEIGTPLPVTVEDNVWLAAHVTVAPGVRIGEGSVIAAGANVLSDIPSMVIAGGNPARVLRRLSPKIFVDNANPTSDRQSDEYIPVAADKKTKIQRIAEPNAMVVSDFTAQELVTILNEGDELYSSIRFTSAPFGQVIPTLMSLPLKMDTLVVWTRPEAVISSFQRIVCGEQVSVEELLQEVDGFCDLLAHAMQSVKTCFVVSWTIPPYRRGLGLRDLRVGGQSRSLAAMNLRLMERMDSMKNGYLLNAQRWLDNVGRLSYPPKLWYAGKVPFHPDVFHEAACDISAGLNAIYGIGAKLIILDLDDTLWGGIVGDDGWENLRLGGHDSIGEAFVDFQNQLKSIKQRGILLGIVSKNTEEVALEAIRSHPEMVLKEEDFVGYKINRRDKAMNVVELVNELNLGLQSVVFIDDNPVERARVREALPEVFVPEWPEDKMLYASTFMSLRCFDTPTMSSEDITRTELYAAERSRDQMKSELGSIDDWLVSLKIEVRSERLNQSNLTRTIQLLNKSNQMNLSTRRLSEQELTDWLSEEGNELFVTYVSDRFGEAGLTGIVSYELRNNKAKIVDFVLSCRVMGRKIEETMLHIAVEAARKNGAQEVTAHYLPTAKNIPCLEFFRRSGFASSPIEGQFFWNAEKTYPQPEAVGLKIDV